MTQLNAFYLEYGKLFRVNEVVQDEAKTEHEMKQKLMQTRPEIFPVEVKRVPSWEELGGEAA